MEKEDKIRDLVKKHSKCKYFDFYFNIVDETDTTFIINNTDSESVGNNQDTNIQFMMLKDTLGFEELSDANFQKELSKFDSNLSVRALKLVYYNNFLLRVIQEKEDKYLIISSAKVNDEKGWYKTETSYMKWVLKNEIKELESFVTYWSKQKI